MPRVLRIVNRFNLGGPTYNACYLTKYLAPEYETLLIGGQKEIHEASSEFIPRSLGVEYTVLPELQRSVNFGEDRKAYRAIKKLIRAYNPDVVHTHASKAGALGRLAAASCGVKGIVHTFHGTVFDGYFGKTKSNFYLRAERYLAQKSSAIIAISPSQKNDLVNKYKIANEKKVTIIPLGFELERFTGDKTSARAEFRSHHRLNEEEIAVGIIGRLTPIKNHAFFLNSIKELRDAGQKFRAFVIGGGELEDDLQTMAQDLGLIAGEDVVFTSWIEDIAEPLAGLDIVALTSLNEGTPVSLIEAQASSRPVVSVDVGGVRDVVKHNETGFVTQPHEFAKYLRRLISDRQLRESMGAAGEQFSTQHFGVQRLAADTKRLYTEILSI